MVSSIKFLILFLISLSKVLKVPKTLEFSEIILALSPPDVYKRQLLRLLDHIQFVVTYLRMQISIKIYFRRSTTSIMKSYYMER